MVMFQEAPLGDLTSGMKVFRSTSAQFHDVENAAGHKLGSNFHGMLDQQSGMNPGYSYSAPNKSKAADLGEETSHEYLLNQKKVPLVKASGDLLGHNPHDDLSERSQRNYDSIVSFAVNLFPDGFSIGKPTEKGKLPPPANEVMDLMYPYNRTSESFLRALDGGWLPAGLLEDIPCTYIDGCVFCELRDYRESVPSSSSDAGPSFPSKAFVDWMPVVHKISLKPTTESIVKDVASMVDETWTYKDLMEVESRILKAIRPTLCLDPTPPSRQEGKPVRLDSGYNIIKQYRTHKGALMDRRLRLAGAKAMVKAGSLANSKKISFEKASERLASTIASDTVMASQEIPTSTAGNLSSKSKSKSGLESWQETGKLGLSMALQLPALQTGSTHPRLLQAPMSLNIPPTQFPQSPSSSFSGTSVTPSGHEASALSADSRFSMSTLLGKRDGRDSLAGAKFDMKKPKQEQLKLDKLQMQSQKNLQRGDLKFMKDQELKENPSFQQQFNIDKQQLSPDSVAQQPVGEILQQEFKSASQLDFHAISDLKVKQESEFERIYLGAEQRRPGGGDKIREDQDKVEADKEPLHQQDSQQLSERILQQHFVRPHSLPAQQLQVLDQFSEKDRKKEDSFQKRKPLPSPKTAQKPDGKVSVQSPVGSRSSELSTPMSPSATPATAALPVSSINPVVTPSTPAMSGSGLNLSKEKLQTQAVASSGSGHTDQTLQIQQVQSANLQTLRRRTNSLPKTSSTAVGVASPGSVTNSAAVSNISSPSTGNAPISSANVKIEASVLALGQRKEPLENLLALVSVAQRHNLPAKKRKVEELPDIKKTAPSWQLLLIALANTSTDDYKEPKGQRNMADSLVGGNVNARKTRFLQFQRIEQLFQGPGLPFLMRRIRVRLVMSERAKDSMVEAVVQFGDDQDDESSNSVPHHVLPSMANAYAADLFAKQFRALVEKDGFELVDDQVQLALPRGSAPMNAASAARPMPAGASTLGNNLGQLPSPRVMMNQHMPAMSGVSGLTTVNPMQPSSPSALAAARMPPPGNATSRQLPANFLGQAGVSTTSKPLQLDGTSAQLAAVHHHQQQQHQLQQHQQPQIQRAQQLVTATQLNAPTFNPTSQISPRFANQTQLQQLQFLQQQHQRQQQSTTAMFQRKMGLPGGMGSLGPMGNMGGVGIPVSGGTQGGSGNMAGLSGINDVVTIAGMNNVSAAMGGISGLANVSQLSGIGVMGQNTGLGSIMGQQLRTGAINPAGTLNAAQMAAISKVRLAQGRGVRPVGATNSSIRNPTESLSGLNGSNPGHSSAGLPMIGQALGRGGLTPIQRAPVTGMGPPKVATPSISAVAGQNLYFNSQQLSSQQQLNLSSQLNPQQQNAQQPLNTQTQLTQQQQMNSQIQQQPQSNPQQQLNPQQQMNPQPQINPQQQLNSQQQMTSAQQLNSPQLNTQQQMNSQLNNQQLNVGSLGSLVGGPGSPQLGSQTLGSMGSITSSPMDLQGGSRGGS